MDELFKKEREALRDLESIKDFCALHLFDIAVGAIDAINDNPKIKIRFIDFPDKFGVTGLGRFFFVDDCMYLITNDEKYKDRHNPDILEFSEDLELLNFSGDYIVRVLFAGIYTGFLDDDRNRIFTGDVVNAKILLNPQIPSNGGTNRAIDKEQAPPDNKYQGGIVDVNGTYCLILDNHRAPLSWATEIHLKGCLFYNLARNETEIDIRTLCSGFAQSRQPKKELKRLIKKSPYFPPTTWEEKAIELLCGTDDNEEITSTE